MTLPAVDIGDDTLLTLAENEMDTEDDDFNPVKKPRRPYSKSDTVYFAFSAGLLKIGVTNNVTKRLHGFKTASAMPVMLVATLPGGTDLETRLHKMFAADHSHGEWFELSESLRLLLRMLPLEHKHGSLDFWEMVG